MQATKRIETLSELVHLLDHGYTLRLSPHERVRTKTTHRHRSKVAEDVYYAFRSGSFEGGSYDCRAVKDVVAIAAIRDHHVIPCEGKEGRWRTP